MDNIKRLFLEAWSLGEQNADNSHGGFGFWWDRNKSIIERELKQLNKHLVMQAEGSEETRRKFCLWYYAQSQPLDANKVFEWFRAAGAAVASEWQGEANTCADVWPNCIHKFEERIDGEWMCIYCGKRA